MQATELNGLTEAQRVQKVGYLFTEDQKKTGILACVSMAQFILESGYGSTDLAQNANNCFGMKTSLSGNTWANSTWDGVSKYTKITNEEYTPGVVTKITADFRKYPSIEESIGDHSAYLIGAMNGTQKRYPNINTITDYKIATKLIKAGGYATSSSYVELLNGIIEKWNLTQFNYNGGKDYMFTCKTIKNGSTGNEVLLLQEILKAQGYYKKNLDGDFGTGTDTAVKTYQKAKNLTVDGIVGPATWKSLIKL